MMPPADPGGIIASGDEQVRISDEVGPGVSVVSDKLADPSFFLKSVEETADCEVCHTKFDSEFLLYEVDEPSSVCAFPEGFVKFV